MGGLHTVEGWGWGMLSMFNTHGCLLGIDGVHWQLWMPKHGFDVAYSRSREPADIRPANFVAFTAPRLLMIRAHERRAGSVHASTLHACDEATNKDVLEVGVVETGAEHNFTARRHWYWRASLDGIPLLRDMSENEVGDYLGRHVGQPRESARLPARLPVPLAAAAQEGPSSPDASDDNGERDPPPRRREQW